MPRKSLLTLEQRKEKTKQKHKEYIIKNKDKYNLYMKEYMAKKRLLAKLNQKEASNTVLQDDSEV
jgi:hypothetical protein